MVNECGACTVVLCEVSERGLKLASSGQTQQAQASRANYNAHRASAAVVAGCSTSDVGGSCAMTVNTEQQLQPVVSSNDYTQAVCRGC